MSNIVQQLAEKTNMSFDEFVGIICKRGCSEACGQDLARRL
jgi:hypothetical protein